jgi:hypothetical protein|eukprot:COSAG01_NODE_15017_length_1385_cov_1.202177_2_plen_88_part_00
MRSRNRIGPSGVATAAKNSIVFRPGDSAEVLIPDGLGVRHLVWVAVALVQFSATLAHYSCLGLVVPHVAGLSPGVQRWILRYSHTIG